MYSTYKLDVSKKPIVLATIGKNPPISVYNTNHTNNPRHINPIDGRFKNLVICISPL